MSVGTLNVFAIDQQNETTYGTAPALVTGAIATGKSRRHLVSLNRPSVRQENLSDEQALIGVMETGLSSIVGKKWVEGSLDADLRLDALGTYLKFTLGGYAVAGAGPYTHNYTVNQGNTPSFTGYWKDANTAAGKLEQFTGLKVRTLTINGVAGGKITFSVAFIGSGIHSEVTCATPALTVPTDALIGNSAISTFTVGGTDIKARVLDWEITFENNYDENSEYGAGSLTLLGLERISFMVSGRLTLQYTEGVTEGLRADAEAQTPRAIVLAITSGTSSATFNIPKAYFEGGDPDGQITKVKQSFTFKGRYDLATSKSVDVVVVNGTTTYA